MGTRRSKSAEAEASRRDGRRTHPGDSYGSSLAFFQAYGTIHNFFSEVSTCPSSLYHRSHGLALQDFAVYQCYFSCEAHRTTAFRLRERVFIFSSGVPGPHIFCRFLGMHAARKPLSFASSCLSFLWLPMLVCSCVRHADQSQRLSALVPLCTPGGRLGVST